MRTLSPLMLFTASALMALSFSPASAAAQSGQAMREGRTYGVTAAAVLEAIERGEGRPALEAHERAAAEAERKAIGSRPCGRTMRRSSRPIACTSPCTAS
jgi:surface antigen